MKIQILGTGCSKCKTLVSNTERAVKELGLNPDIEKVTGIEEILKFQILMMPGLVIDGQVKAAGRVPSIDEIKHLLVSNSVQQINPPLKGALMSESCCCSKSGGPEVVPLENIKTNQAEVPEITTNLSWRDKLGFLGVRWGISRMHYSLQPGLYRIGKPDKDAPVLVTANFKMTVDLLRKELGGMSAWILVLNTYGINVWCAAGKGTFGTNEVVQQIENADLKSVVAHREIILPQLGAPGVAAHEVRKRSGFRIIYGPVYARDIPAFLANGKQATPEMRRVRFRLRDRIVLIPMELIPALKWLPVIVGLILIMRFVDGSGINIEMFGDLLSYLGAIVMGTIAFQILLPWIPGRSFVWKGWLLGIIWSLSLIVWLRPNLWVAVSNLLVLPVIAAYLAFNFTGATTFTSLSGVQKEIRLAAPVMIASAGLGIILRMAFRLWI